MANAITRFLGDSPVRIFIKLAVLSLVVGIVMRALGWRPRDIYYGIVEFVQGLWNLGFEAIYGALDYLLLGAAIVIPAFVIIRILNYRSGSGS